MADTDGVEATLNETADSVAEEAKSTNINLNTDVDTKNETSAIETNSSKTDNDHMENAKNISITSMDPTTMTTATATTTTTATTGVETTVSPVPSRRGSKEKGGAGTPPRSGSIFMKSPFTNPTRLQALPVDNSIPSTKEGILYKQRDFVKGWRPRHFVLKSNILHYYLDIDDNDPKKSLDLTGCTIGQAKVTKVNDTDYYALTITQPNTSRSYNIASLTQESADEWVDVLSTAAAMERSSDGENENTVVGETTTNDDKEDKVTTNVGDFRSDDMIEGLVSYVNPPHSPPRNTDNTIVSDTANEKHHIPFPVLDDDAPSSYFSPDRSMKYSLGTIRLFIIVLLSFAFNPAIDTVSSVIGKIFSKFPSTALEYLIVENTALTNYITSLRFLGHAYLGSIGALVNVEVGGKNVAFFLLMLAAFACFYDSIKFGDISMLIYLMKTFSGDFLAGKIDTQEWKAVFFFVFGVFTPSLIFFESSIFDVNVLTHIEEYQRIFIVMFLIQFVCELGDAKLENVSGIGIVFRHRYSFEILTLAVLFYLPNLTNSEQFVIQVDLVACLFYRFSNFLTIWVMNLDFTWLNMLCLQGLGVATGVTYVRVTDPEIATAVLKQCTSKGRGLEYFIACSAWEPIWSLESVGGKTWREMKNDFMSLLKKIESADNRSIISQNENLMNKDHVTANALKEITSRKVNEIIMRISSMDARSENEKTKNPNTFEANTIVRLTLEVFILFVFGREWHKDFEILIAASWEFRKELAVRGEGDSSIKKKAVKLVVENLIKNSYLWNVYGEKWNEPRYYSLIMQPFLISPAINVGDIMCSVAINGPSCDYDLETCMRLQHPFPIFERYTQADVTVKNEVAIEKGIHVIMFTSDFADSKYHWPVFGAGSRACAGGHIALPVLRALMTDLVKHPLFNPLKNHKYSGRHLDGKVSYSECMYFIQTVLNAFQSAMMSSGSSDEDTADKDGTSDENVANKTDEGVSM